MSQMSDTALPRRDRRVELDPADDPDEVWPLFRRGSDAREKNTPGQKQIFHSPIQKGFARAEVITFDDFVHYGGRIGAKEAGKARAEGREYLVKDGDIILFLHSS